MGKLDVIALCSEEILFYMKGRPNVTSQPQNTLCLTENIGIAKSYSARYKLPLLTARLQSCFVQN